MLTIKNYTLTSAEATVTDHILCQLTDPTTVEIEQVSKDYGISVLLINSSLKENTLTRVHFNHTTSVYFSLPPTHRRTLARHFHKIPTGIFYNDNVFLIVSKSHASLIDDLLQTDDLWQVSYPELVLKIMYRTAMKYIELLEQIDKETEKLERSLRRRVTNTEIFQLMDYQRSLTGISTNLKGLEHLTNRIIMRDEYSRCEDMFEDTVVAVRQATEMAAIYNSDLDALMDAFGSVISNNVNQVMKILTSLTLIITIPTMIAGIFGMNVDMPFTPNIVAFWIIVIVSTVVAFITGIIFYIKRML